MTHNHGADTPEATGLGEALLPCPFCGTSGPGYFAPIRDRMLTSVYCTNCEATGPVRPDDAQAADAWNAAGRLAATLPIPQGSTASGEEWPTEDEWRGSLADDPAFREAVAADPDQNRAEADRILGTARHDQ